MRKKKLLEKAADIFDLPGEAAAGMSRLTITGYGKIHVENHRGLLEYGSEEIEINGGNTVIKITGKELELTAMSDCELVASGRLSSVEFIV